MDFLIGLLAGIAFCSGPMTFLFIGWKQKRISVPADEEKQRKAKSQAEKHREDLMNLINYDVDKATAKKKVK